MRILLVEPYFGGSHAQWARGLQQHSRHDLELMGLPARHWKWRMHGGALSLAGRWPADAPAPDLLLASDMLDLGLFLARTRHRLGGVPAVLYFHENQLTYPWSGGDTDVGSGRDQHYAFINVASAAVADRVWFNSEFHRRDFLRALPAFLSQFPDHLPRGLPSAIEAKSTVLPPGFDLAIERGKARKPKPEAAVLLWNHRWEYDKDPETFFRVLRRVKREGLAFRLIVAGQSFRRTPPVFERARAWFADELIHFGYVDDRAEYSHLLDLADILPVTSRQDFFGISAVEAIARDCFPLLPDRLAFPEHIPAAERGRHLYADEEELFRKLSGAIRAVEQLRKQSFRHFVARYDWRTLIEAYDRQFASIGREVPS